MHFKGLGVVRNSDQALSWYRRAAVLGNVDAAKALGKLCTMGYGGEEDFGRAIDYYQKVAGAGNRGAMYELGLLYSEGSSATLNLCKAVEWYEKAALRGSTRAMFWDVARGVYRILVGSSSQDIGLQGAVLNVFPAQLSVLESKPVAD